MKNRPPPRHFEISVSAIRQCQVLVRSSRGYRGVGKSVALQIHRPELKRRMQFLLELLTEFESAVSIRFADAEEMQQLNETYRGYARPTDVLSFPSQRQNLQLARQGIPEEELRSLGDLCVCIPICLLQAQENRQSASSEVERMLIHGLVHLRGFDHERNEFAHRVMTDLEVTLRRAVRTRFGKPDWLAVKEKTK